MSLKTRRTNALLEPLAPLIDGRVADGVLTGAYQRYGVEAEPHAGYPIMYVGGSEPGYTPPDVEMFKVTLARAGGSMRWTCQSSPSSPLHQLAAGFTAGRLLRRFAPGEFKFEGVDTDREGAEAVWEKLLGRLAGPLGGSTVWSSADEEVQERLIAAGLFDELDALRWGGHPYLPKLEFIPSGRELTNRYVQSSAFTRGQDRVDGRLHSAGLPDYRSILEKQASDREASLPGRLSVDVEIGKARVPTPERFQELLVHLVRIAQINLEANPPTDAPG